MGNQSPALRTLPEEWQFCVQIRLTFRADRLLCMYRVFAPRTDFEQLSVWHEYTPLRDAVGLCVKQRSGIGTREFSANQQICQSLRIIL